MKKEYRSGISLTNKGFTLIELLVVVLIIAILAAVALPQYRWAVEKSRFTQVRAFMKEMVDKQKLYYLENGKFGNKTQLDGWSVPQLMGNKYACDFAQPSNKNYHLYCYSTTSHPVVKAGYDIFIIYHFQNDNYPKTVDHLFCLGGSETAQEFCKRVGGREMDAASYSGARQNNSSSHKIFLLD